MFKSFEIEVKTRKGKKVYISVEGEYTPYKPQRNHDHNGNPGEAGSSASFEIRRILFDSVDVTDHLDFIDDLVNAAIWATLENEFLKTV